MLTKLSKIFHNTIFLFLLIVFSITMLLSANVLSQDKVRALISTDSGDFKIQLFNETPLHRDNFIKLVRENFYNDLLFHRVIKDFIIQGGDPLSRNAEKGELLGRTGTGYTIPAEINTKFYHKKGVIAAARAGDETNPFRESSGSQFYIIIGTVFTLPELRYMESNGIGIPFTEEMIKDYTTIGGAPHLDGAYTIFGEVISNIDVVDKISMLPTDPYNRPINDIKFKIKILD